MEVQILHGMMRYFELPGEGEATTIADISMGLLGDVRAAQVPAVVEINNRHFSHIGAAGVRVPTVATMLDQITGAPPGTMLGPYVAEDAPGSCAFASHKWCPPNTSMQRACWCIAMGWHLPLRTIKNCMG